MSSADTKRLAWLAWACHRDTAHAPHLSVGHEATVIWDQYNGLQVMGKGPTLHDAIDDAMSRFPAPTTEETK